MCWDTGALPSEVCGPAGPPPGVPGPAPPRGPGSRRGKRKAAEAESLSLLSTANKAKGTRRTEPKQQSRPARAHRGAASRRPASGPFIRSRRADRYRLPGVPGAPRHVTAGQPIAPGRGEAFPARANTSPRADQSRPPLPAHASPLLEQSRGFSELWSHGEASQRGRTGRGGGVSPRGAPGPQSCAHGRRGEHPGDDFVVTGELEQEGKFTDGEAAGSPARVSPCVRRLP